MTKPDLLARGKAKARGRPLLRIVELVQNAAANSISISMPGTGLRYPTKALLYSSVALSMAAEDEKGVRFESIFFQRVWFCVV
jgi:hypothetical protein